MWLSNSFSIAKQSLVLLSAALLLAACELAPVYVAKEPGGLQISGDPIGKKLASIEYSSPKNRSEQIIYQTLKTSIQGVEPQVKIYLLETSVSASTKTLSQLSTDSPNTTKRATLSAIFSLTEAGGETILLTDTRSADATFSTNGQPASDQQALRDAEERASQAVAEKIRLRLVTFFANENK